MKSKELMLILSKVAQKTLGDKNTYRLKYFHQRHRFPNLKDPKDLSERLVSRMFSPDFGEKYAMYADKVAVREYVKEKGLGSILLKHYAVWNKPDEIDLNLLPNKFILKANNGSGGHVICRDKDSFNLFEAQETLRESILMGENSIEPHYRHITPMIFAEELIDLGEGHLPTDYKFTCINGIVRDVFVAVERSQHAKYCTFDTDWNPLPYTKDAFLPLELPEKPQRLKEMSKMAEILSKDFDFVRVDFYNVGDKVFFSELTFTPWGGIMYSYTDEAIKLLGEMF